MNETQLEPMSDSAKAEAIKRLIGKIQSIDEVDTQKSETVTPTPSLIPNGK